MHVWRPGVAADDDGEDGTHPFGYLVAEHQLVILTDPDEKSLPMKLLIRFLPGGQQASISGTVFFVLELFEMF